MLACRLQLDAQRQRAHMTVDTSALMSQNSDSLPPTALSAVEHSQTIPSASIARRVLVVEGDSALRDFDS